MKIIIKLTYNTFRGGVILFFINMVGHAFGFSISLNFASAFITGFLGIPGIAFLVVYKYLLCA